MKKNLTGLLLITCLSLASSGQGSRELKSLYKAKQFEELNKKNSDNVHEDYYFYKAVYASVSNQPGLSNQYLDSFILLRKRLPRSIGFGYWTLRNDNYIKLFDYQNAFLSSRELTNKYKRKYSTQEYKASLYSMEIWRSLIGEKRQEIRRSGNVEIPLTRDLAGLINIGVETNGIDTNFVFDTGAGMSCVTQGLAHRLGLRFVESGDIQVSGFNNIFNIVQIAVADELRIGDITVHNEPFLVFDDSAFSFAGGAYRINGIIGFPIAREWGSTTITPSHLIVGDTPAEDSLFEKNLFVEMLRPIIYLKYKGEKLPFNFDTGANSSTCSKTFYDEYGRELEPSGRFVEKGNASAGGTRKYRSLEVKDLGFIIGNEKVVFPVIDIDTENYHVSSRELFGNIGQDLLKRYKKVTINFSRNYIKLSN